jgi:hypothetical protein
MILSLSNGRRVAVSVHFVAPDDESVELSGSPEVLAQVASDNPESEVTQGLVDTALGMTVRAVAQLTVTREDGVVEASFFMSKDELKRHIVECRAIFDSMDEAAGLADRRWSKFRESIRREARKE